jgi:FKBP-type peptidyl-prolyl cis-trans isomerase
MKLLHIVAVSILPIVGLYVACTMGGDGLGGNGSNGAGLGDAADSLSYVIGRDVGSQLEDLDAGVKLESFMLGVEHALKNREPLIDSAAADSIRRELAMQAQQQLREEEEELARRQREESDKFLEQNRTKAGVETTPSGLQYKVLDEGAGPMPAPSDSVWIQYVGMFPDSTIFDSVSSPVALDLRRAIPGLAEGIPLMRVGATYRFFLPPELAYGAEGIPPIIPPNAVLIFDVELVRIEGEEATTSIRRTGDRGGR